MNVLVIPEDFRKDQYILKPIVKAMLRQLGKPSANIEICRDPLLRGVAEATSWSVVREIIERYRMVDLFVLCVDRDGVQGRRQALDRIEQQAARVVN